MEASESLPLLTAAEARVLGCLIEKEATTPDVYPLTINATQAAANQKTAREPVIAENRGQSRLFQRSGRLRLAGFKS